MADSTALATTPRHRDRRLRAGRGHRPPARQRRRRRPAGACPTRSASSSATPSGTSCAEAGIEIGTKVKVSTAPRRRHPGAAHRRRGDGDRGRVRPPRIPGGGPRLRPVAPPQRGPQDADLPERQAAPTSPSSSRAAPGCRPKSTTPADARARHPGRTCRTSTSSTRSPARSASTAASTATKLYFKRPTESADAPATGDVGTEDPVQLVWGNNLLEFRARISAVAQVSEVKVRGWDVTKKKAVIGKADATATNAELSTEACASSRRRSAARPSSSSTGRSATQEAADALAKAKAEQVGSAGVRGDRGRDRVAGAQGRRRRQHHRRRRGPRGQVGHQQHAPRVRGGRLPDATSSAAAARTARSTASSPTACRGRRAVLAGAPGVVVAIVTNNDDPDKLGRVKVKFPWLSDDAESCWARLVVPGAGPESGVVWIPEVRRRGPRRVRARRHSHARYVRRRPVERQGQAAPSATSCSTPARSSGAGFVSRKGHKFVFFDGDSKSGIALLSADGKLKVSLNETKNQLHIVGRGRRS